MKACLWCQNPLPKRRRKYCSDNCAYEYWVKYLAPLWWVNARRMALRRTAHKCEECGNSEGLEVHHVVPLESGEDRHNSQKNNQANLRVLCRDCHEKVHHPNAHKGKITEILKEQVVMELV